jgi:hypothetical protein
MRQERKRKAQRCRFDRALGQSRCMVDSEFAAAAPPDRRSQDSRPSKAGRTGDYLGFRLWPVPTAAVAGCVALRVAGRVVGPGSA